MSWRVGHCRLGRSMGGNGRYFFDGSFSIGISLDESRTRLLRVCGVEGFQSCLRRLVARVYVRLGRKKEERERSTASSANGWSGTSAWIRWALGTR